MPVKAFVDLDLIIRTCKLCRSYREEGMLEERVRTRAWIRTNIVPDILRLSGLRGDIYH